MYSCIRMAVPNANSNTDIAKNRLTNALQWSMTISLRTTVFIVRKTKKNYIIRYFIEFQLLDLYLSWSFCTREPFP